MSRVLPSASLAFFSAITSAFGATYNWTNLNGGSLATAANWSGAALPPSAADHLLDFSTLNITAARTLTLDGDRTAGSLKFGDLTTISHAWTLNAGTGGTLTLSTTTGTPSINVNNASDLATINLPIASNQSFSKTGNGLLVLSGSAGLQRRTLSLSTGYLSIANPAAMPAGQPTANPVVPAVNSTSTSTTLALQVGPNGFAEADIVALFDGTYPNVILNTAGRVGVDTTQGDVTLASVLAGTRGLAKVGAGKLIITGANTYTGGTHVPAFNGIASVVDVSGDQSAANGGWSVGAAVSTTTGTTTVNFLAGSTIAVAADKTIVVGNVGSGGNVSQTLNVSGAVTNEGKLTVGRPGVLNVDSGGTWQQSGETIIRAQGGFDAKFNVRSGGSYTSTNALTVVLTGAPNGGAKGLLTIDGTGVFTTSSGFEQVFNPSPTTASGYGRVTLTNGGTIRLGAAVTDLTLDVQFELGAGGGVIDTNGFSASLSGVSGAVVPATATAGLFGTGGLTKRGAGTLTLTGVNTYTGATTVEAGTLSVSSASQFGDSVPLVVAAGATLDLNHSGTETVGALTLGGAAVPNGIYGSLASSAPNKSAFITGTGLLNNLGVANVLYWDGTNGSWANPAAWSLDSTAVTPDPTAVPTAGATVNFGLDGLASAQSVALGANQAATTLNFRSPVDFGLTGGGADRTLGVGTGGITLQAGAGNVTVGSATVGERVTVALNGAQTWTNPGPNLLSALNGVALDVNPLTLAGAGNITLGGGLTATTTAGTVRKLGAGTLTLSGGSDALSAPVLIDNGTTIVSGVYTAPVSANWTVRGSGDTGTAFNTVPATVLLSAGSQLSFASGTTLQVGDTAFNGSAELLVRSAGQVTMDGSLSLNRRGTLTVESGTWQQNGPASVTSRGGGLATLNVLAGATFTYANAAPFVLRTSVSSGIIATNLNLDGGTFVTGVGFENTETTAPSVTTTSGPVFTNAGTLRLTANVADLFTTAGGNRHFIVGTGGGVIDTNGFATTLNVPVTGVGGLTKAGAGIFTTTAANTYTGNTTVTGGTLALSGAGLDDASTVSVGSGALLALNFTGSDTVAALFINGVQMDAGVYTSSNSSGALTGTGTLTVTNGPSAADTIKPVITLTGSAAVTVDWGSSYTDAGATATDNVDSSVTVNTSGTVNTAKPGSYTITYTATDAAGNVADSVTRTVTVSIANATAPGTDGYSPLLRYALGANSPTDTVSAPVTSSTPTTLSLTAVVRTDDPALTVGAEAVNDLAGTWGTGGTVTVIDAADQSGVPTGSTRKVFTVVTTGSARKFLRLTATLAP